MGANRPPWWMNPIYLLAIFVLPLFLTSSLYGEDSLRANRIYANYMNAETINVGASAIIALCVGAGISAWVVPTGGTSAVNISSRRITNALTVLAIIALVCELVILLSLVPFHLDLVIRAFNGEKNAAYELQNAIGRIPGVTSLMHLRGLFFALASACLLDADFRFPRRIKILYVALALTTIIYSFVASERVAIIEMIAAAAITPMAFKVRPSLLRTMAPLLGGVGAFGLFASSEYFRSWPFYRDTGISFLDFVVGRFVGYFSTSNNNGAGYFLHMDPVFVPYFSATWVYKFPLWALVGFDVGPQPGETFKVYLERFASVEFNNYSGVYAMINDFGWGLGSVILVGLGFVGGTLYRDFCNRGVFGLLLYPVWIYGYLDLIRVFYWGEPRFFPMIVGAIVVYFYLMSGHIADRSILKSG